MPQAELKLGYSTKDLRTGLAGKPEWEKRFLHQYMTLTRCDLFFADKAITLRVK